MGSGLRVSRPKQGKRRARIARQEAKILEVLPGGLYRVSLEDGQLVLCHVAASARLEIVKLLPGDRVDVERSALDVGRGRIVSKHRG